MIVAKTKMIRQTRIVELRNITVRDLKKGMSRDVIITHLTARCVQIGVSKPTMNSYIDEVFTSLLKKGEKQNV